MDKLYETDKYLKGLITAYDELFREYRITGSLLEIGVHKGGFLQWANSTGRFSKLVGIDIDTSNVLDEVKGFALIYEGHQREDVFVEDIAKECGGFDVVVDDGSHEIADVAASFATLWPHTRRLYIVEDWDLIFEQPEEVGGWFAFMIHLLDKKKNEADVKELKIIFSFADEARRGGYIAVVKQ